MRALLECIIIRLVKYENRMHLLFVFIKCPKEKLSVEVFANTKLRELVSYIIYYTINHTCKFCLKICAFYFLIENIF